MAGIPADLEPPQCLEQVDDYRRARVLPYGAGTVRQAEVLLDRSERFFGLVRLGADMEDSAIDQTLLAAYDKLSSGAA